MIDAFFAEGVARDPRPPFSPSPPMSRGGRRGEIAMMPERTPRNPFWRHGVMRPWGSRSTGYRAQGL
eukprot:7705469-Pyramimonas_sp.AAC.1